MKKLNKKYAAIGRLAAGVPKTITKAESRHRAKRMRAAAAAYNAALAAGTVTRKPRGKDRQPRARRAA